MGAWRRAGRWLFRGAVAVAVLSVAGLAVTGQWDGAVRFAAVTAVLLWARRADVPPVFMGTFAVFALVAMWAAVLRWYAAVPYLDLVVHFLTPGSLAAVGYFVLVDARLLPDVRSASAAGQRRWAPALWVVLVGTAAAVVWEYYEWAVEQIAPEGMIVGYTDTVADLLAGMLGSAVAGALVLVWAGRRST